MLSARLRVELLALLAVRAAPLAVSVVNPGSGTGGCGVLIRSALTDAQQLELYEQLCSGIRGSTQWTYLEQTISEPRHRPWPLCVWQHPFTGRSNLPSEPRPILDMAHALARRAAR